MKIVVKVGGSLVFKESGADAAYLRRLLPVLEEMKKHHQLIVAIGGGKYLRKYMHSIDERSDAKGVISLSNKDREEIYIQLLAANVLLLSKLLKMRPIKKLSEVKKNTTGVIGGIVPGRCTDANAALAAVKINADLLVKITNVDGIYDKDPNKHKDAKILGKISFSSLVPEKYVGPVSYGILDPLSVKTIKKHKIRTIVMNGDKPENLLLIINGEKIGTEIC